MGALFLRTKAAFTLIELLIVIAVIAIVSVVVILVLNPAELVKQSRDSNRMSDLKTISSALSLYLVNVGTSLGTPSTSYISIPDPTATSSAGDQCQGLGMPALPSGWNYHCAATSTYRKTDGTGWIPVDLTQIAGKSPLSKWPVDPINTSSTGNYYSYEMSSQYRFELNAKLESQKYSPFAAQSGGQYADLFSAGTDLTLAPFDYAASSGSGGSGYNGYAHYRSITIGSNVSGTLSNFPMVFSGTYSWLAASSSGGLVQNLTTVTGGGMEPADLTFNSSASCGSATALNFETESYISSNGSIVDWIDIPTMQNGAVIYACYDDSAITTDQSRPHSTWNSSYAGVWHLADAGNTQSTDSTGNGNTGTNTNTTFTSAGQIDGAGSFNGSNSKIDVGSGASLKPSQMTISAWIKASSYPNAYNNIASMDQVAAPYGWTFRVLNGGNLCGGSIASKLEFSVANSSACASASAAQPSTGILHYVAGTYNGSLVSLYEDGALMGTSSLSGAMLSPSADLVIGEGYAYTGRVWNGAIDEVEYSNAAESSQWILTAYNNQSSPAGFYTIGAQN